LRHFSAQIVKKHNVVPSCAKTTVTWAPWGWCTCASWPSCPSPPLRVHGRHPGVDFIKPFRPIFTNIIYVIWSNLSLQLWLLNG
jgi:hypothetical protein